jgi:methyltransferase (TIGR00027 family)
VTPAPDELSGVSRTALGVARVRAAESLRADRLFDDPYASAFVAAYPRDAEPADPQAGGGGEPSREQLRFHIVMRTRFFDEYLLVACARGCAQVVLLAAGLDARAFRLDWPAGTRLFEVDLPPMVAFKRGVLDAQHAAPRCDRIVVEADLREDWRTAILDAGFDPAQRTAWLVEGLLIYLDEAEAAHVLGTVTSLSALGSEIAMERGRSRASDDDDNAGRTRRGRLAGMWKGGLGEGLVPWLDAHGWQARVHDLAEVAAAFGRPVVGETRSGFVTARYGSD